METTEILKLNLLVINAQKLESGLSALMDWDQNGGLIGSSSASKWVLKDANGHVHPQHCEIVMFDGAFCLRDLCGETYINGTEMPIGKGSLAKLVHKDQIQIGPYKVRVALGDLEDDSSAGSLTSLFETTTDDLLSDDTLDIAEDEKKQQVENADPLAALDELMTTNEEESLIDGEIVDASEELDTQRLVPEDDLTLRDPNFTVQADSDNEISSSMSLKRILSFGFGGKKQSKQQSSITEQPRFKSDRASQLESQLTTTNNDSEGFQMDEQTLDLLEEEVAKSIQPEQTAVKSPAMTGGHLLTGPMLNGLGANLNHTDDIERMHMLSQEMGESLQACIQGILDLHQQVSEGRFGTLNRNLQPIEDNPLRLGLSYQETIRTLYDSEKSAVHLSAPAAIEESLKNVQAHNEAMQHATGEALTQILGAFSPQVLLRRFQNYKRSHQDVAQNNDEWAWKMYCNYYQELTSHRQQGFEKLFWEIFEQAYDKKIREKQLEF
ncbi:type VI secretion system-associated FHA domain protein TagH [Vibrio brasiliensis]|uniref:type VI secretion system-associated FHA domain protein TagH n=1 Tax=Vibrio brasiliensis TaxID=170652 RepID=UPI001EFCF39F|nr:type VI secretion system-associated FHA domain protein TagH [Vibrio brasiliensis]MCG9724336.1 type VI secretion system-associated FHA domain protein TagH [Vibrio brasiliensis]